MNPALILTAVLQYGPSIVSLLAKLHTDVASGKTEVTPADWAELTRLAGQSAASIYAKEGVDLPS